MRILVISNLYPPSFQGGYELGCAHVAEALLAAGHEVRVLSSGSPDGDPRVTRGLNLFPVFDPATVAAANPRERRRLVSHGRLFDADNVETLRRTVAEFQPDVAYLWNLLGVGGLGLVGWLQANRLPWVWHLMDAVPRELCTSARQPEPDLLRTFAEVASGYYLVCSSHVLGEIRRGGFQLPGEVELVPNWVAGPLPGPRASFYPANGAPLRVVTAVGVLIEHKGIDLLIEAVARLGAHGRERLRLDIYGRRDDDRFDRLAVERGVQATVNFCGLASQDELMRQFSRRDVFAFPTEWREPFAFAPLEAAAAGCVPLLTDTCGNAEWMVGGVHCLKAPRTADAFAGTLAAILEGEIDLAPIGRRGQALVRDMFHLPTLVPRIESALQRAASQGNGAGSDRLLTAAAAAAREDSGVT